jgi:hypothetical protein
MGGALTNEVLDRYLPVYGQREVHHIRLPVPPARAWRALWEVTLADLPLTRGLLRVRNLPALLLGRDASSVVPASGPAMETFRGRGWLTLANEPGQVFAAAAIGRFWRPVAGQFLEVRDADEFTAFRQPGFARAVMSFEVFPDGTGSTLVTETRVHGTDPRARRLFALYWLLIRPGSGLIRIGVLRAVRRRCQAQDSV